MNDLPPPENSLLLAREIDERCDEFEAAWKAGERPRVETLLPQLSNTDLLPWLKELLPIEWFHRFKAGQQPRAEEYLARFPALGADWIEAQLAEHAARAVPHGLADTMSPSSTRNPRGGKRTTDAGSGIVVPGYEFIGELGRGAMGVVYKAWQLGLGRIVALKMIRSSDDAGAEELARFKSEAAAIARLQHPNIVQVYDFGEHAGRPYFSLEFIDGGTLAQKVAGVPQAPRDAARTIETMARAIHQAHVIGIVHRDLKPANVLVTRDGVLKITDFGLAKQTEADHAATATGMLLGTPQYMAPEQAAGNAAQVGPATDIYALGAILYELLTGRPPFQAANLGELLQAIGSREPSSPRLLKHDIPRDLETICLKCLQKSPPLRYASAAALADDLRLYLADQPILARPITPLERSWRWCRRNPWIAIPSASLVALLLIVSIASLVAAGSFKSISDQAKKSAKEAKAATKLADVRARDTQLELARSRINEARMLRRSQRVGQQTEAIAKLTEARDILRELKSQGYPIREADWQNLRDEAASALLVPDLATTDRWPRESAGLHEVACNLAQQHYLVFRSGAPEAEIRRLGTGKFIGNIAAPKGESFTRGIFSEDGNRLALFAQPGNQIHFYDTRETPQLLHSMPTPFHWRGMSRDGRVYVAGHEPSQSQFIHVTDGKVIAETTLGLPVFGFPLHPTKPWAVLNSGATLILFDYEQQRPLWKREAASMPRNIVWSHDGRWFAITTATVLQTFTADTGERVIPPIFGFEAGGPFPIPASQTGLLIGTDWSGSLRVFNLHTGRLQLKASAKFFDWPLVQGAEARFTLAAAGPDYVLLQAKQSRLREFALHATFSAALSDSGRLLAVYRQQGDGCLYHLPSGEILANLPTAWGNMPLGFEPDEKALFMYGRGELQRIAFNWTEDKPPRLQVGPAQSLLPSPMRDIWGMDRKGTTVVVPDYGRGGDIYRLSGSAGEAPILQHTAPQLDVRDAQVSPDGQWAVFGSHVQGKVAVYSTQDAKLVRELVQEGGWSNFSPNGEWLAVGKFAGGGELFAVNGWKSVGRLPGQRVAFTTDGRLLAVDSDTSTLALYETKSLRKIAQLEIQDQVRILPRCFTPDGTGLVAWTMEDRRLLYFDLAGLRDDLQKLKLDWDYPRLNVTKPKDDSIPAVEIIHAAPQVVSKEVREQQVRSSLQKMVQAQARQQQWLPAARTLKHLCQLEPNEHFNYYQLSILQVYLNDEDGYRSTIREFREKFANNEDGYIQERLAKALALGHHWIPLDEPPAKVIATVRAEPPLKGLEDWCLATAALIDLRQQKFDAAINRLQRSQELNPPDQRLQTHLRFLSALAWQGKGERQQAERANAEGIEIAKRIHDTSQGNEDYFPWQDDLVSLILRREAEAALKVSE